MWALLARVLGPLIERYLVREAAEEILKKYGMNFLRNFIKDAGPQLGTLSKQDILNLAQTHFQNTTGKLFRDQSTSAAKKFSGVVNKKIDIIEDKLKDFIYNQTMKKSLRAQLFDDFQFASGRVNKATEFSASAAQKLLLPVTKPQAFGSGFFRGLTGETLSRAVHRAMEFILAAGQGTLNSPRYRVFIRTMIKEIKYLRSIGEVKSANQLWHAIQTAYKAANRTIPGIPEGLIKYQVIGNASGRLTAAGLGTYVFVDDDTRKQRVDKFKKTVAPFTKKKVRTYVNAYIRDDGTKVKGHYRTLEMAGV